MIAYDNEEFIIDDDAKADWAIEKIAETQSEYNRLINLAKSKIESLQADIAKLEDKSERETSYLRFKLADYFLKVPHKITKTQESYKLLSGTLVMKKPTVKVDYDDEELIAYLKEKGKTAFIKTTEKPAWAELKKTLTVTEDVVFDSENGEIIDCIHTTITEPEFDIKLK